MKEWVRIGHEPARWAFRSGQIDSVEALVVRQKNGEWFWWSDGNHGHREGREPSRIEAMQAAATEQSGL